MPQSSSCILQTVIVQAFPKTRFQGRKPAVPQLSSVRGLSSRLILDTQLHNRRRAVKRTPPAAASMANLGDAEVPILVSPEWLKERLGQVKVLDANWYLPFQGKNAAAEFQAERIPGAQFYDLDEVGDKSSGLPHMLPTAHQFAAAADALGITNDDVVVVYDHTGVWSAPRGWWTWRVLGHSKVAVLDGGLPAWKSAGGKVETSPVADEVLHAASRAAHSPPASISYRAQLAEGGVRGWRQMLDNITSKQEQVMDARPTGRWEGKDPEPRPGLPSGHIPGSTSIPYASMLENGRFKSPEELQRVFEASGIDFQRPVVSTCGSGTTACILLLATQLVKPGKDVAVYDGSWTEWAQLPDVPIETRK